MVAGQVEQHLRRLVSRHSPTRNPRSHERLPTHPKCAQPDGHPYGDAICDARLAGSAILRNADNRRASHGSDLANRILYLPSVISGVAVSLLWMWIFNSDFGLLNYLLWKLFRIEGPAWIMNKHWVVPSLIMMSLWGIGGGIVIYLARLQGIPTELYEAAEIDGANGWQRLLHITIPMMTPVIFFNLIMGVINSFQVFTQAYVMTGGGPHNASLFYVLYLYRNAFKYFRMGYASALAWILFLMLLLLTLLVLKSASWWVYYESEQ